MEGFEVKEFVVDKRVEEVIEGKVGERVECAGIVDEGVELVYECIADVGVLDKGECGSQSTSEFLLRVGAKFRVEGAVKENVDEILIKVLPTGD